MAQVIAITNQKGGVGKTTTSVNLVACLGAAGHSTLLVDLDPQGNATTSVGLNPRALSSSVYRTLVGLAPPDPILPMRSSLNSAVVSEIEPKPQFQYGSVTSGSICCNATS